MCVCVCERILGSMCNSFARMLGIVCVCKRILLAKCKGIPLTNVCGMLILRSVHKRIMMCKRVLMWNLCERLTSGHERKMVRSLCKRALIWTLCERLTSVHERIMIGLCKRVLMWNLFERLTSGHERKMVRSLCKRVLMWNLCGSEGKMVRGCIKGQCSETSTA